MGVTAVAMAACSSGGASDGVASPLVPTVIVETLTPAPLTPTPVDLATLLRGFIYPIQGGCLPRGDQLMPNAPREYRQGLHEGIDFYNVDNCTAIGLGAPVMAAKGGRVVRVDSSYRDMTPAELQATLANPTTADAVDRFRGRQVWIDHGNGIVTRYCHLSGIAQGLAVGQQVAAGQLIAFVGESGTPESITNPGHEYHLHFELRIGDSYLGAAKSPADVRAEYTRLFAP